MSDIFPPRMSIEGQLTAAADRIKELEAQLDEVRGLPEEWRKNSGTWDEKNEKYARELEARMEVK